MVRREVQIDPAVAAILGEGERRQEERSLPRAERRQRVRDRSRTKLTVDLPEGVIEEIREVAEAENVGVSSLVHWLLVEGLREYREVDRLKKEAARSLKFSYNVVVEGAGDGDA